MAEKTFFEKYFKSSEEVISMFLGLVIVLVVAGMVMNYFQKRRGSIGLPGVVDNKAKPTLSVAEEFKKDNEGGSVYKVKQNDSLWKIAVANYGDGYAYVKIAKENNLKTPGVLVVGQELRLPVVERPAVVSKEAIKPVAKSYVVLRGDSLWKIAVANYGDGYAWTKIWKGNRTKLVDPDKLEIGMTLMLE